MTKEEVKTHLTEVINALTDLKKELIYLYEVFDTLTPEEYDNRVLDILNRYEDRHIAIL